MWNTAPVKVTFPIKDLTQYKAWVNYISKLFFNLVHVYVYPHSRSSTILRLESTANSGKVNKLRSCLGFCLYLANRK